MARPKPKPTSTSRFYGSAINRRDFIATALALGVSLGGATAVVKQAEAATPKSGGRLRQGHHRRGDKRCA